VDSFDGLAGNWDGHVVLIHHSEWQRRRDVAAWVRSGLDLGAKVIYTERAHVADRSLRSLLTDEQVDAFGAISRGQLRVLAASDETYTAAWQVSMVEDALAEGYPEVWWSGEAETAWSIMTPAAHADVEWETDRLCESRPVSILCQYPAKLPPATLDAVCAMHGGGVRESLLRTSPCAEGMVLAGEADASNEQVTRSALRAATSAFVRDRFVLDLRALRFLDVAGVRSLLAGTAAYRSSGGVVCLRNARSSVDRVLRLLGVDRAVGVTVEER